MDDPKPPMQAPDDANPDSDQSTGGDFPEGCLSAVLLPFGFLGLSLIAVFIASQLGYIDFNLLYALGMQVVLLLGFTIIYVLGGLD